MTGSATIGGAVAAVGVAFALGWLLTLLVRRYALRRSLLDVPNARSSHVRPTPRGGGLAIVLVASAGVAALWALDRLEAPVAAALLVAGGLVAAVGWLDDRADLSARLRLAVQFAAATLGLLLLGGLPELAVAGALRVPGWAVTALGVIALVWLTNLYNFMDGIDGLAGGQAVVAGAAGGVLLWRSGSPDLALALWVLGGAAAGFLVWNWSPARIFMGDVGSGYLGLVLGLFAVATLDADAGAGVVWLLVLAVFLFDATVTLLRRMLAGERLADAHRSHAYQRLVQAGWSHRAVSAAALATSIACSTVALLVAGRPRATAAALVGAAVALGIAYAAVERRRPMAPAGHRSETPGR